MKLTFGILVLLVLCGPVFAEEDGPVDLARVSVTIDEVITWLSVGVLVASLVLLVGNLGHRKMGRGICLLLGLIGAGAGGFVVDSLRLDTGLGAIVITYESLLASLAGALILLLVPRLLFRKKGNS